MPKTAAKLEDYEVLAVIGTGTFGTCKKVKRRTDNKVFVWKEIDYGGMGEKEKQLLVQEVNLLRELRHPHIVRYHDRIIERVESTLYIIMEFCEGGDLATVIARARQQRKYLEERFIWKVFHQLLLALEECHRQREGVHKVLHRDLKPANVFLDSSNNVKLGDFGLARILHHNFSLAKTFVGTPYYMSPEQLTEQLYNESSDLWSLGCLVYELAALNPPFNASNQRELSARVIEGRYRPLPDHFSGELKELVHSLLKIKPKDRPDIPTLLSRVSTHVLTTPTGHTHKTDRKDDKLKLKERSLLERERAVSERERRVGVREKRVAEREKLLLQQMEKLHHRLPLEPVITN